MAQASVKEEDGEDGASDERVIVQPKDEEGGNEGPISERAPAESTTGGIIDRTAVEPDLNDVRVDAAAFDHYPLGSDTSSDGDSEDDDSDEEDSLDHPVVHGISFDSSSEDSSPLAHPRYCKVHNTLDDSSEDADEYFSEDSLPLVQPAHHNPVSSSSEDSSPPPPPPHHNPTATANTLTFQTLTNQNLPPSAHLSHCTITNCNIPPGAHLSHCKIISCDIAAATLINCNIISCNIATATLTDCRLTSCNARRCTAEDCTMTSCNLVDCWIGGCAVVCCNVRGGSVEDGCSFTTSNVRIQYGHMNSTVSRGRSLLQISKSSDVSSRNTTTETLISPCN